MKIFVIGASGRVGSQLVKDLRTAGHDVSGSYNDMPQPGLMHLDLHESVEANREKLRGYDVVYFAAGSSGDDLIQVDLYGSMKAMQIAKEVGVKRFVMISSAAVGAIFHDDWYQGPHGNYLSYNIVKYVADEWLQRNAGVAYTIVRPGVLVEGPATGKVTFAIHHRSYNSIADVALVAAKVLDHPQTIDRVIPMGEGSESIDSALAAVK